VLFTGPASEQKPGQRNPCRRFSAAAARRTAPQGFKEPDLKGNKNPPKPLFSRKEKFADWVTRTDNPYFTKAIVNRVWAQFMGRGLVDPVDDIRESQPASLPKLFQTVKRLIAHNTT
jgi:hypothetical protein